MEWFEIKNIEDIDTPALMVFPARMQANIDSAIQMVGGPARLRPHVKTHKSKEASQMLLDAGITRFKCATIAEAEMLGMILAPDVLLAYQPVGPKIARLIQLIKRYPSTRFSCLVDDREVVKKMSVLALSNDVTIEVFLDLDVGMHRTGIVPDQAFALFELCEKTPGIKIIGLHVYDGHLRDPDLRARKKQVDEALTPALILFEKMKKNTATKYELICGGSPTFPLHATSNQITCSPGTFIYWDHGYTDLFLGKTFIPAAVLITRIVSVGKGYICTDLGHKSVAAENSIDRRILFLNGPGLKPIGQSEEHLVLQTDGYHDYTVGDVLYGIPFHICPTVALYDRVYVATDHLITAEWFNIARDRKIRV